MTTVVIIQARMGSTRFPGKMTQLVAGVPLIEYLIQRIKKAKRVDKIVLATGSGEENQILLQFAAKNQIIGFAGSENDVLDRYYQAAKLAGATTVARVTGDCPFFDPVLFDTLADEFHSKDVDYISNVHPPTFPDGYDMELFRFSALEKAWQEATLPSEREHVTPFIWKNKEMFTHANMSYSEDLSKLRVTIDEPEDLEFVNKVIELLNSDEHYLADVIRVIRENPEITKINNQFKRNEGYAKSLLEDEKEVTKEAITQNPVQENVNEVGPKQDVTHSSIEVNPKWKQSTKTLAIAKQLIPSAAQTYSKSYFYFTEGAAPAFLDRGNGAYVWDVDGNKFTDFILGLGPVTLGYNDAHVNQAIIEQLSKGMSFTLPIELEVELAQKLVDLIPCAEMVKFVKNGSDATAAAIRLARGYTNREIVLCSGYHGYQEWYVGTTDNDKGVPVGVKNLTKKFDYNDIESVQKLFETYQNQVAAVILEPVQSEEPKDNFLHKLRALCDQHGAVLIFDEVVTGFRMAIGGAQEVYNVTPDLASFGKGMANGAALSLVCGKRDIMKLIDEGVFISTTFGGEGTALAASLKTIEILQIPGNMEYILNLGNTFLNGVTSLIEQHQLKEVASTYGASPHCGATFKDVGSISSKELLTLFQQEHLERGILSLGVNNFCLAHTMEDVNACLAAVDAAFAKIKTAIEVGSVKGMLHGELIRPIFGRRKE